MRPQWWMNCKDMAHEAVKVFLAELLAQYGKTNLKADIC